MVKASSLHNVRVFQPVTRDSCAVVFESIGGTWPNQRLGMNVEQIGEYPSRFRGGRTSLRWLSICTSNATRISFFNTIAVNRSITLTLHARSACPSRKASNARTSVTYCNPSSRGTRCSRSLSVGSLIQPSMGIALSVSCSSECVQSLFGLSLN